MKKYDFEFIQKQENALNLTVGKQSGRSAPSGERLPPG